MAHTLNTFPIRLRFDMGMMHKSKYPSREYSFGKLKPSGPGGYDCNCCNSHLGNFHDSKNRAKMRRYVRRVSKMDMVKEIAAEMDALHKEFEDLMDALSYDYDDYDYYDPWDMYCFDNEITNDFLASL